MAPPGRLPWYRRTRVLVGGLAALLAVLTAIFYAVLRARDLPPELITDRLLMFALWYVNVVLILAVVFVLARNLFKLALERRARILGSKFKTKLVATYVGLSLVPVLLLFFIASELLQGSIDRWFATPVRQVLEQGYAVSQALQERIEQSSLRAAGRVGDSLRDLDLDRVEERPLLGRRLQALLAEHDLDYLAVYRDREFVHGVLDPGAGLASAPEAGRQFLATALADGSAVRVLAPTGFAGRVVLAAAAADPAGADDAPRTVVVAGSVLAPEIAAQTEELIQAFQGYRQLEVQRSELKASHLLLFLMMTLLILLASSWTGIHLARRVTVPIQALAEGTRRISQGELGHRVEVDSDDELGVLVDSFNRMTDELQKNRELIERRTQELVDSNRWLAEQRALIAAVLQNVAAGVISVDAEGRIFTCNDAALAMLRQQEREVLARTVEEAWADPERCKLAALLREAPDADDGRLVRELRLALGGEWKTFEVKITPMRDPSGAAAGRIVVLEDLTELLRAQQLATWNEAARRIAHEIKNPLTPIQLSAERILKKHREGDARLDESLEQGVETIIREVETMKSMVDEFARFARMPQPQPEEVDLEALFAELVRLYRDLKPGVELAADIDPAARTARFDREQMRRALINLLDNAVEATEPPGTIELSAAAPDARLRLTVADTGRGIPPSDRERLFLPYFSTKGRGSGLGLAIVHRIVSDHHGTIRVEANRPRGTVLTIDLPQG